MIVANLAALEGLLGTTGAHDTIVAAYTNADTVITGTITNHVLAIKAGKSTMDRLRGRAIESLYLIQNILGVYNKATNTWGGGWCCSAPRRDRCWPQRRRLDLAPEGHSGRYGLRLGRH